MIRISEKKNCCGCCACVDVCPPKAISLQTDIEGFWYPHIDAALCVDCGLCDKTCPQCHSLEVKKNEFEHAHCFAAVHKNMEVRFDSTSGGVFSALANYVYRQGGYVGGALYNDDFSVRHFISQDKKDLKALRSSKYLQSNAVGFYNEVKKLAENGATILVCGTPCQMAALRLLLGENYENLLIVDFICRGINSPKVFRKYLDYLEARFGSKVVQVKAKNKELGWRQLTTKVVFEDGQIFYDTKDTSYFTKGYLRTNVFSRPSCYQCQFKGLPRMADITIADLWGAEKIVGRELDNDLGTSLVMVNNGKGEKFFSLAKATLHIKEIPLSLAVDGNPALLKSQDPPLVDRNAFYKALDREAFEAVARQFIERTSAERRKVRMWIRNIYSHFTLIKGITQLSFVPLWQTWRYNRLKAVFGFGSLLIPRKYSVIQKHPTAQLLLHGHLKFGVSNFMKSKLESRLELRQGAQLIVNGDVIIGYGADIEVFQDAKLEFAGGGGSNIGLTIICGERITIGKRVMMGRHVTIRDNNGGHFLSLPGYRDAKPIEIGDHAWLGEGCTIMPGVKIGVGAIIGSGAVVVSNVPAHALVMGNPATVIVPDVYWKY